MKKLSLRGKTTLLSMAMMLVLVKTAGIVISLCLIAATDCLIYILFGVEFDAEKEERNENTRIDG